MSGEVWKPIAGFPYHQVSNLGRVRSLDMPVYNQDGSLNHVAKGRVRKASTKPNGYKTLRLRLKGPSKYVHRLVMETFCPTQGMETLDVNHIDGDKANNRLDNLEWCTRSGNMRHAYDTGICRKGDDDTQVKILYADVERMRKLRKENPSKYTERKLAELFGLSRQHVGRILRNERRVGS